MPKYIIVYGKTGRMVNGVLTLEKPGAIIELNERDAAARGAAVRLATPAEIAAADQAKRATTGAGEPIPNQYASTSGFPEDAAIRHDLGQDGPHHQPVQSTAPVQRGPDAVRAPATTTAPGTTAPAALPAAAPLVGANETTTRSAGLDAPNAPTGERRPAAAPDEQRATGAPRETKPAGTRRSGGRGSGRGRSK
jgi:hypothetical protein